MVLSLLGEAFEALRELTLDDRLARLKGVAEPLRPFIALTVFLTLDEARDGVSLAEDLVTLCLRLLVLLGGVGVGDREVALEEAGVDNLDRDELGVSERSCCTSATLYLGFCTPTEELFLELVDFGPVAAGVSCCSESIRRCVLERRLELVRPDMV